MKFLTSTTRFAWFAILLLSAPLSHRKNTANDPMGLQDIKAVRGSRLYQFSRCR